MTRTKRTVTKEYATMKLIKFINEKNIQVSNLEKYEYQEDYIIDGIRHYVFGYRTGVIMVPN